MEKQSQLSEEGSNGNSKYYKIKSDVSQFFPHRFLAKGFEPLRPAVLFRGGISKR